MLLLQMYQQHNSYSNNQMPEYLGNGFNDSGVEKKRSTAANISNNPETHSVDDQSSDFYDVFKKRELHFLHITTKSLLPNIDQVKHLASSTQAAVQ